jgi:UDP-glucose 4-epimerase
MNLARDYRGVSVLVTGADGFIGSHLTEALVAAGAHVRAFCFYNSQGSAGWLDEASPETRSKIEFRFGDIRDHGFVASACEGIEVVFNLAALIAIPYSYVAPESFVATNVVGMLNVLEAARRHKPRRIVHTSTSEVYGTPTELPIVETHPLNAQSPYAATKVAADQLALSYHCSFQTPVTILRPFNTFGPRQSSRAVLMTLLSQLIAGQTEIELGRLDTKRDLTFVADTVDGFLRAGLATGVDGDVVQLGTGHAISIGELFELACSAAGTKATVKTDPRRLRPDASEVLVLESSPARAKQQLGWTPTTSLEDGVRKTVEWLRTRRLERGSFFQL